MKLRIFQSEKGDCLLLSSTNGNNKPVHVLVDGGMAASYTEHVSKAIGRLPALDVIYVSHIDQDHISGVLRLVNDAFDWYIYDQRVNHPKPKSIRPPKLDRIWHNAFHAMLPANDVRLQDLVIATAAMAAGTDLHDIAIQHQELATSIPEAIQLSSRISSTQLGLKHNQEVKGKLLMARPKQKPIEVGKMKFTIIGPFQDEIDALRDEWNKWLKNNDARVKKLRAKAVADAKSIAASSLEDVAAHLAARAGELGDRAAVTVPNLASLMFLVEEDGRSLLLTGDGHQKTILEGLERAKKMAVGGGLHVNVLKVQHHGSENNIDKDFCQRVTADDYIFCGNGAHTNPELDVIKCIVETRLGDDPGPNRQARNKFKLWFNSHSSVTRPKYRAHMEAVEKLVEKYRRTSGGQVSYAFLKDSAFPAFSV